MCLLLFNYFILLYVCSFKLNTHIKSQFASLLSNMTSLVCKENEAEVE